MGRLDTGLTKAHPGSGMTECAVPLALISCPGKSLKQLPGASASLSLVPVAPSRRLEVLAIWTVPRGVLAEHLEAALFLH